MHRDVERLIKPLVNKHRTQINVQDKADVLHHKFMKIWTVFLHGRLYRKLTVFFAFSFSCRGGIRVQR
jgi:hypothetical protein